MKKRRDSRHRLRRSQVAQIADGMEGIKRLVRVDQKPIGRTPRSNLATYTGLFDHVRKLFAATKMARGPPLRCRPLLLQRRQRPLRNLRGRRLCHRRAAVPAQRLCACPTCHGARYNAKTLEIKYRGQEHRRRAGHDGRCGLGVLRRRAARAPFARTSAGSRPGLPAARPARDRTLRRRGAADQARDRAAADPARATRSIFSTSRPPACIQPTSTS